jgi:hypothetical protein
MRYTLTWEVGDYLFNKAKNSKQISSKESRVSQQDSRDLLDKTVFFIEQDVLEKCMRNFNKRWRILFGDSRVLQKVADFYLRRAEFYKVWRIFTWGKQSFTKGGVILIVLQSLADFYLR